MLAKRWAASFFFLEKIAFFPWEKLLIFRLWLMCFRFLLNEISDRGSVTDFLIFQIDSLLELAETTAFTPVVLYGYFSATFYNRLFLEWLSIFFRMRLFYVKIKSSLIAFGARFMLIWRVYTKTTRSWQFEGERSTFSSSLHQVWDMTSKIFSKKVSSISVFVYI